VVAGATPRQLILTVTRACDLRCSYCPTVKDGFPSLSPDQAVRALHLFAERYAGPNGGDVKLFGGEPLLVPDVIDAVFDAAEQLPQVRRLYLSTNGRALDADRLQRIASVDKAILTISLDGRPEDHRRYRRGPESYDTVVALRKRLASMPRVVITQTIAPAAALNAAANFDHLLGLGFRRFNFLPGYFLAWSEAQLGALRTGFAAISARIHQEWRVGHPLYVRNLFTWAPTPFFNEGLIVDSDGTIHPSNVGLAGSFDDLRERTVVGTIDDPPSLEALDAAAKRTRGLIESTTPPRIWRSTQAADGELTRFVQGLLPAWAERRRARRAAPAP
jgi:hypothetical protein